MCPETGSTLTGGDQQSHLFGVYKMLSPFLSIISQYCAPLAFLSFTCRWIGHQPPLPQTLSELSSSPCGSCLAYLYFTLQYSNLELVCLRACVVSSPSL